jgi:hypothetical protein
MIHLTAPAEIRRTLVHLYEARADYGRADSRRCPTVPEALPTSYDDPDGACGDGGRLGRFVHYWHEVVETRNWRAEGVGSEHDYPGPCICAWFSHVTPLAEAKLAREGRHDDRLPKLRGELPSRRAIRSLHTTPYFFSTIVTLPISQTVLP